MRRYMGPEAVPTQETPLPPPPGLSPPKTKSKAKSFQQPESSNGKQGSKGTPKPKAKAAMKSVKKKLCPQYYNIANQDVDHQMSIFSMSWQTLDQVLVGIQNILLTIAEFFP